MERVCVNICDHHIDLRRKVKLIPSSEPKDLEYPAVENMEDIKILPGDILSLIPYGHSSSFYDYGIIKKINDAGEEEYYYDYKYNDNPNDEGYDLILNKMIEEKKYMIEIDPRNNTHLDLLALFIIESKRVKCKSGVTLYDAYHMGDSFLIFNTYLHKVKNCWFLSFDT